MKRSEILVLKYFHQGLYPVLDSCTCIQKNEAFLPDRVFAARQ